MTAPPPDPASHPALPALVRASRAMASEAQPAQALWKLLDALREDLEMDRAGVFAYDPGANTLDRVTGIDREGNPEFGGRSFPVTGEHWPMLEVARRERPYYLSNRLREEYPEGAWTGRMTAHGVIPIMAGDRLLGTLNVDNALTGHPLPPEILDPLFLYAGLAALPLLALYQQKERARNEEFRRRVMREMVHAVTNGKVHLLEREEIDREWPRLNGSAAIQHVEDVPPWRDVVREAAVAAGMAAQRAKDLELCAAEAASNALFHGRGGRAALSARADQVRVRVADRGGGIDPQHLPRMTLVAGASSKDSAGLGYTLMTDLADRLYLYSGADGTDLIIEMCVQPQLHLPEGWADLI